MGSSHRCKESKVSQSESDHFEVRRVLRYGVRVDCMVASVQGHGVQGSNLFNCYLLSVNSGTGGKGEGREGKMDGQGRGEGEWGGPRR